MTPIRDQDRRFLLEAYQKAVAAQCPPGRLGLRPEPAWAALIALGDKELVSAAFSPGDPEDAVRKLLGRFRAADYPGATLYLTLEPKAAFDRLPPVTESVRRLGVSRVVIGTLDPAQRYRGEGKLALEQAGIEVVLADGEEARCCQDLLDDYAKWLSRGLAVLRAQVELSSEPDGTFGLGFGAGLTPVRADAVICRAGGARQEGGAWRVVIDPEGWERPAERAIVYQTAPQAPGTGLRRLPLRDGQPDLGALLRDLGSLGVLSVELSGDPDLFRLALRSGLIDSVKARFAEEGDSPLRSLSQVGRVRLSQGGSPLDIRLNGTRLVSGGSPYLEASVELC